MLINCLVRRYLIPQSVEVPVKVEIKDETVSQPLIEVVESLPLIVEVESQPLILPIEPEEIILDSKLQSP